MKAATYTRDEAPEVVSIKDQPAPRNPGTRDLAALWLSLWIHLTSFALGAAVFTAISLQSGTGEFVMLWPLVWWSIGLLGHVAAVIIAELVARFGRRA